MKIKIFKKNYDDTVTVYENRINEWLRENEIEIIKFSQVIEDEYIVTSFLYYEKSKLRLKKIKKLEEE